MNEEFAIELKKHALQAISELSVILNICPGHLPKEKFEEIKRGVGISIGNIQMELLELIYKDFPELDDLK